MEYPIGARARVDINGQDHSDAYLSAAQSGSGAGYREVWLKGSNTAELVSDDQIVEVFDEEIMPEQLLKHHLKHALPHNGADDSSAQILGRQAQSAVDDFQQNVNLYSMYKDSTDENELLTAVTSAMALLQNPELIKDNPSEQELLLFIQENATPELLASFSGAEIDDALLKQSGGDPDEISENELSQLEGEDTEFLAGDSFSQSEDPKEAELSKLQKFQTEPLVHISGIDALLNGVGSLFSAGASLGHSMTNVLSKRSVPDWLEPEVNRLQHAELNALLSAAEAKSQAAEIAARFVYEDPRIKEELSRMDHNSNSLEAIEQNNLSQNNINELLANDLSEPWQRSCELAEEAGIVCKEAHSKYKDLDEPHDVTSDLIDVMRRIKGNNESILKLDPDTKLGGAILRFLDWVQETLAQITARFDSTSNGLIQDQRKTQRMKA